MICRPPNSKISDGLEELNTSISAIFDSTPFNFELTVLGEFNIDYKKTRSSEYKMLRPIFDVFMLNHMSKVIHEIHINVKPNLDYIISLKLGHF